MERGNIQNDVIHKDAQQVDHFWCLYGLLTSSGKFLAFEGEVMPASQLMKTFEELEEVGGLGWHVPTS